MKKLEHWTIKYNLKWYFENKVTNILIYSHYWIIKKIIESCIDEGYIIMDLGEMKILEPKKYIVMWGKTFKDRFFNIFEEKNGNFFQLLQNHMNNLDQDKKWKITYDCNTDSRYNAVYIDINFNLTDAKMFTVKNIKKTNFYFNETSKIMLSNVSNYSNFSKLLKFNVTNVDNEEIPGPSRPDTSNPIKTLTNENFNQIYNSIKQKSSANILKDMHKDILAHFHKKNIFKDHIINDLGEIQYNNSESILKAFIEKNNDFFNTFIFDYEKYFENNVNEYIEEVDKKRKKEIFQFKIKIYIDYKYVNNNTITIVLSNNKNFINFKNDWNFAFNVNNISFNSITNVQPMVQLLRDDEIENMVENEEITEIIETLKQDKDNTEVVNHEVQEKKKYNFITYNKRSKLKKSNFKKIIKYKTRKNWLVRQSLSEVFRINNKQGLNLGQIENTDDKTILEAFIRNVRNSNENIPSELLVPNNLYVIPASITSTTAMIRIRNFNPDNPGSRLSFDYRGFVLVIFNISTDNYIIQRDLNDQQPNMGSISEDDRKKIKRLKKQHNNTFNLGKIKNNSREEITSALMEFARNNGLLINSQWVTIQYITEYSVNAHIEYFGHNIDINIFIEFNTNFIQMIDISSIFVITDLGTLPHHETEERSIIIRDQIINLNSENNPFISFFNTENIFITNITQNTAIISVNERDNNYFGSFTVTFNLDAKQENKLDDRNNCDDDSDGSNNKEKEIKEKETKELITKGKIASKDDIISAKRIKKDYNGKNLHVGDLFIGTKNGLLLLINELIISVDNIIDQVNKIEYYENKNIYALTNKQEIYFIKINTKDNTIIATGEKIKNVTSSDLDKEISLFYEKKHDVIKLDWYNYQYEPHIVIVQVFDLHNINPLNYEKIEFLGSDEDFKPTKVSWSDVSYESDKKINHFNNSILSQLLKNQKFQYKNQETNPIHNELRRRIGEIDEDSSKHYSPSVIIQPKETQYYTLVEWIEFEQDFEIAFYWEKGHYYLQIISRQYAHDNPGSIYGGSLWMGFGNGIRLYNE